MIPMRRVRRSFALLLTLLLAFVAMLTAGPQGMVDWRAQRAITIESDDWGLSGFVPDAAAWDGRRREDLTPGSFPAVYWNSTLEDSGSVAELAAVLGGFRGRDGQPALLQPNYILSALAWEGGQWRRYDLPELPQAYQRPGMWTAVREATGRGVWYPEFHGAWHYDPERRQSATAADPGVAAAAERGIMLFPGSEAARELGPWRSTPQLAAELDTALAIFGRAFGRRPGSLIAPDYTWDGRIEALWASRTLVVLQAKREQRHPRWPHGPVGRVLKVVDRQWSRAVRPERTYLERNCRLEPAQSPDAAATVAACLRDTRKAWRRGEPAIVESHRVNFAHADPAIAAAGRRGLREYLECVAALEGGPGVFLADVEVASLMRHGVSLRQAGEVRIARNGTHSRRVVFDPAGLRRGTTASLILLDSHFEGPVPASADR
jgi:hypothetical protein